MTKPVNIFSVVVELTGFPMSKPVGGRGIKAPYETTHVRVPVPIKDKVQALIDEFRDGYIRQPEKSPTCLDKSKSKGDESLRSAFEIMRFQADVINRCNLEIRDLNKELELRREELELQRESIQSQKEELGIQSEEIRFQDQELRSKNSLTGYQTNRDNNLLTSLEDAKEEARKQLRSKKGKYSEVAELLSFIYKVKVTKEDLEA